MIEVADEAEEETDGGSVCLNGRGGPSEPTIDEATADELGRPDDVTTDEGENDDSDTDEDDADEAGNGTGEEETRPS